MSAHGYGAYTRGCRCDVCRGAKADYMRARRAASRALAARFTTTPSGERGSRHNAFAPGATRYLAPITSHGSRYGYEEAGCRCQPCTAAHSESWTPVR
jgi:hypothetical protein